MNKVWKYLKERGDVISFVNMKDCLKIAASGFSREVFESEEMYGISLPFITKVDLFGVNGVYSPTAYEDKDKDLKTQKLWIFVITEGHFFEIDIPGQGVFVFYYDGKQKGFATKNSFNKKEFEDRSAKNIDANSVDRANRKAAEDLKRQSASVKPFIADLDVEPIVRVVEKDIRKAEDGGTFRPFAILSSAQAKATPQNAAPSQVNGAKKSAKATAKAEPAVTMAG